MDMRETARHLRLATPQGIVMGLQRCILLLGPLMLLGPGITQAGGSPEENASEEEQWPKLMILKNLPFSCDPKKLGSHVPSESVHSLKPSDIKFVATIGNMETFQGSVYKEQKLKWTGQRPQEVCQHMVTVLSDVIRYFNPSVLRPKCVPEREVVPHNGIIDLQTQATELVKSMKVNQQLDFQNDWKLINVFFSNASRCQLCAPAQQQSFVSDAMDKLTETLDYLYREVPKAFVNLVDFSEVLWDSSLYLGPQLSPEAESCGCSVETSVLSRAVTQWTYQEAWHHLLASSRYNEQDSFALVFQPFFYEADLTPLWEKRPLQDPTTLALHLWDNMMKPVEEKDETLSTREQNTVKCPPQEYPYLFTYRNSDYPPRLLPFNKTLEQEEGVQLECHDRNPSRDVPTSVHSLRPADIKVIGALGDSLTAANGASAQDILGLTTEFRGVSWSIGGDRSLQAVVTLPNIFREFNHKLRGFSIGTGKENSPTAFLNQAVSGAKSTGLMAQARQLVTRLRNDKDIDFQQDWKIITIFIGGNDLCAFCNDPQFHSPEHVMFNVRNALDILHTEVPRTFVNLVNTMEIICLRELYKERRLRCPLQLMARALCSCVVKPVDDSAELALLADMSKKYQDQAYELVDSGRYDTGDDFTVVVQPLFERLVLPRSQGLPDKSFFAPDCFHFSKKAHGRAASALWNNMLEPVGQKTKQYNFESMIPLSCPAENQPFLRTYKNSLEEHGSFLRCKDTAASAWPPDSVHSLKAADIKVVAALGDSLIAGSGINFRANDFDMQYRGLSFSAGGDGYLENVSTLANIFRKFNKNLIGFAVGTGDVNSQNAFFNQAVPNALAKDLKNQVQALAQKMKTDHRVKPNESWKVITVMIGASDLCEFCKNPDEYSADKFLTHLREALDTLREKVPKSLVNLVDFMNPSIVRQVFQDNPSKCPVKQASQLCHCVLTPKKNSKALRDLVAMSEAYQNSLRTLVGSGRYDSHSDFAVVLQPFFSHVLPPLRMDNKVDLSYFSADCYHPSQKFHSQLARGLWTNMIQPLGSKTDSLEVKEKILLQCPPEKKSFLSTAQNSNYKYPPPKQLNQNWGSDFTCQHLKPSKTIPTSVHQLQPSDFHVVAALGDWMTTAEGAQPGISQAISWRGLSWSIGGDKDLANQTTLPSTWKEMGGLNVAMEGARAWSLMAQAKYLITLMQSSPEVNMKKDWKLITLFIGINDLCDYCANWNAHAVSDYAQHIEKTLDYLSDKLPRTFVNLVELMDIVSLYENRGQDCTLSKCACLKVTPNTPEMEQLRKMNQAFQRAVANLSSLQKYQREDFAVVAQPFFRKSVFPRNEEGQADLTYFSKDCFHFSSRAHDQMAIALWNNMLEPLDSKTTFSDFTYSRTSLKCPSPTHPYVCTYSLKKTKASSNTAWFSWLLPLLIILLLIAIGCGIMAFIVWRRVPGSEPIPGPRPGPQPGLARRRRAAAQA
ncbi:phospholipase B1, membrane-associated isoform X3 [Talpa occidentalis]|uniref:phospholipase B1, membrane-associated isoform X3 n=1 Tax=Talpa occidentalis TaxID=50954 RepID=UPI00188EF5CA|nr:phospholipase B1, membrane-associated isoform X3 [Talpa occidentalis]